MADYLIVPPGGGERLLVRGSTLLFKAVAKTTGGAFSLHERQIPAGGRRPPAHVHPDRAEAFWVLDGEAEFELDGELAVAGPAASSSCPAASRTRSARPQARPRMSSCCMHPRSTATSAIWPYCGRANSRPAGRTSSR